MWDSEMEQRYSLQQETMSDWIYDIPTGWEQSFIHATRHLINAFHNGGPPRLTGSEGRTILRFLLAAHQSAGSGQPVRV